MLFRSFTVDQISLPALRHTALGQYETSIWSPDLKNPANAKFVDGYLKKAGGKLPSFYAAQTYDGIMLLDSGVRAVKGNLGDKKGMIAAMRKANFNSVRGKYTYNNNHHPIENFYLLKAVAGPTPSSPPVMEIQKTVFTAHKDSYSQACKMKW